jgi:hypothetical protein
MPSVGPYTSNMTCLSYWLKYFDHVSVPVLHGLTGLGRLYLGTLIPQTYWMTTGRHFWIVHKSAERLFRWLHNCIHIINNTGISLLDCCPHPGERGSERHPKSAASAIIFQKHRDIGIVISCNLSRRQEWEWLIMSRSLLLYSSKWRTEPAEIRAFFIYICTQVTNRYTIFQLLAVVFCR